MNFNALTARNYNELMLTIRLISKYTIITIHFDILHSISH